MLPMRRATVLPCRRLVAGIVVLAVLANAPVQGATVLNWDAIPAEAFQPTPPMREATVEGFGQRGLDDVSTHAPRAGSDA